MRLLALLVIVPLAASAQAPECVPTCRSGFACVGGQCVSRCNPPCGAGERCMPTGECEASSLLPPPPPAPELPPDYSPQPPPEEPSGVSAVRELPGWALGGAVLGFVSAGVVGVLALGSGLTSGDLVPSLPLGLLATVVFGVTVPLVAGASSSVRTGTGASGVTGLRVAGWILYGLTLANAVVCVVLGVVSEIPAPLIYLLGGLGITTEAFMSIDALVARSQASDLVERNRRSSQAPRLVPIFGIAPGIGRGGTTAVFGVGARF